MSKTNVLFLGASLALVLPALHAQTLPDAKHPSAEQPTAGAVQRIPAVPAAAIAATADDTVAAQLVKLQTEVMLLKAQTAKAQAQAELQKASAGSAGDGGGNSIGVSHGVPAVLSTYGRDDALTATLRLNSGGVLDARVGDSIPGGYRLAQIDGGSVTFAKGGRQFKVGLSGGPAMPPPVQGGGALMLAPPLPARD
ncbi:type IV pilus biogenesis protein PilP [Burkholderia sp. BCC0044]|uniref:type IV pilus biogenesis protein PilP n=1 Tax=Burkholderia sp. BCC0044 TaxID=2676295 RepID=UPI00158ADB80|nr:type IV pilus biogenesis protein PilP [Burkholderia sp. BCC0044]